MRKAILFLAIALGFPQTIVQPTVELDWNAIDSGSAYRVERNVGTCAVPLESWQTIGTTTFATWTDVRVYHGHSYSYRVRTLENNQVSDPTPCVDVTL